MKRQFDPVTLEILWRRLLSIVDEADAAVARTAFSSLLRDAHDYTCMFTDRRGRELAQGTFATPGQSGAMALGVKKLVQSLPADSFRPGDTYITNDPWALAGHLNDVCVLGPIFHRGRLAAFTACILHHGDIGGRVASDNREVFEEGLFIPLVKLYDGGRLNQGVLDMIRANVRTPEQVTGDIRSQVAANHVCAEKILRMLEEQGWEDLDELAEEIIGRSEASMRAAIAKAPPGVYRAEGAIEQGEGQPDVVIKCAVEIAGSDINVDLAAGRLGRQCRLQLHLRVREHGGEEHFRPRHPEQRRRRGADPPRRAGGNGRQLPLPGGGRGTHADRAFHDRDHLPCARAGPARARGRGLRRNAGDA